MKKREFNYDEEFMGIRKTKSKTYRLSFKEDYRIRSLVKMIIPNKGKLLDAGCGGGVFTESLPYYIPKVKIYGCDVSRTAIGYAKKLGSGKVKYSAIKNKRFPYEDNFFDSCICVDVLEHVSDVNFFLKEVRRVLKKNGKLFLIVPCEGQPFTHTWLFQKMHVGDNLTNRYFGHIHPEYTHKSVIALLQKHGFTIAQKAYSEHLFYQFMHLLILFLPKRLLEILIGEEKTHEYTASSLVRSPKSKSDPVYNIRKYWLAFYNFMMMYPMFWETVTFRRISLTAWKLHVLANKK